MPLSTTHIADALAAALDRRTIRDVAASEGRVRVRLEAGSDAARQDALAAAAHRAVGEAASRVGEALAALTVEFVSESGAVVRTASFGAPPEAGHRPVRGLGERAPAPQSQAGALPGVRHAIAVGAGKGGVGKSTIAVNLAVGLARRGHAVGLMDGDIYGPSMPTMLGLESLEAAVVRGMLQPFYVHGVKAMTIGRLVEPDKPLIWRGPMAHGAFKQLVEQTEWGELEYLVIDLPPGTGDVALTMAQMLRLTGAVIVCTPQKVAQDDAVRAARMFQQLGVEVLGVVENMSHFVGDDGKEYDLFGRGGAERMAARLKVPFLGGVPITMALRENSDRGEPLANFGAGTALGQSLEGLVTAVENQAALAALRQGSQRPTLKIT